jgi:hypothetical protein
MNTITQANSLSGGVVTTSYGGENIVGFRVIKQVTRTGGGTGKRRAFGSIAGANKWLLANEPRVDAHAKESTRRLIGRESL